MEKIEFASIVQVYLRTVPHAADILREVPEAHRSNFEAWPDKETDLFDFLSMAFVRPILLPKLRDEPVDRELDACFEFIEGLAKSSNGYVDNALYFEVYEQFLESREILLKALQFCRPVTRRALLEMLTEHYPGTLEKMGLDPRAEM
ncbi:hypothetical protein ACTMTF_47670 [Nonomuraea sp. ZG12]|uniref:hypothetical protein n=1 Tax=Nonomuraea sp. ZG12 TaxID=3452207 RepID=UPI003F8906B0